MTLTTATKAIDDVSARFQSYLDRHAAHQEPLESATRLRQWILDHQDDFASVMECDLKTCSKVVYDFRAMAMW